MANSPSNQPARSISLPCRPHPKVPQIQEHLSSLQSLESASTSLGHKLSSLKDLYDCLDDLIILPQNQSKLTQNAKRVDELLDGSLRLLDVCGIAKDVLSQLKEHIKEIQSSLRRRSNGGLISIGDEIFGYVNMRKKTIVKIKGCLKDVKGLVKRFGFGGERKEDGNVVDVLREVEGVTAQVFETLLGVVSAGSKPQSLKRSSSLPFVMCSRIMHQNGAFEKAGGVSLNEFEEVDATLGALIIAQKKKTRINITEAENLRAKMVKLDSSIQDLDEVLEGLFRCLLKTRATLLNILSH